MKLIPVGRVISPHGVRGEVKFRYYSETEDASLRYSSFFVDENGKKIELRCSRVRRRGAAFILKFEGLERKEDIHFLLKKELLVREEDLPSLEQGEYYDYQLIGLKVDTEKGESLGTVTDIMHTKANDILVIEGERQALVPLTEDYIISIDTGSGSVRIKEEAVVE